MTGKQKLGDLMHSDKFVTVWLAAIATWTLQFVIRSSIAASVSTFVHNLDTRFLVTVFGFAMTVLAALFLNRVSKKEWVRVAWFVAFILPLSSYMYSVASLVIFYSMNPQVTPESSLYAPFPGVLFAGNWFAIWGCLYFSSLFILRLQRERERTLRATTLAHEAQLKMLRYQLNPHFLFNTLNGISTLVLDKKNTTANQVLVQLSQFLRHTLDSAPDQNVTLSKELSAIQLYLDIEKTRFEDRLAVHFDVSQDTEKCLVPSLLLQPIIENSIKYAVAPSQSGGEISIQASVLNGTLSLRVTDNGPGISSNSEPQTKRPGVGLANTRLRLKETYGDNSFISLENLAPRGLQVTITIPAVYNDV